MWMRGCRNKLPKKTAVWVACFIQDPKNTGYKIVVSRVKPYGHAPFFEHTQGDLKVPAEFLILQIWRKGPKLANPRLDYCPSAISAGKAVAIHPAVRRGDASTEHIEQRIALGVLEPKVLFAVFA